MTSSSDGEPLKRRVLVRNLPLVAGDIQTGENHGRGGGKISKADIRRWFSAYGPIACVHRALFTPRTPRASPHRPSWRSTARRRKWPRSTGS